ncbi:MAG: PglZ domain-containing protein, partial [Flavobacteriales bacterium]
MKYSYHKILNLNAGRKLADSLANLMGNPLNVIVYNFVDMLSHARTEMEVIRELAEDDAAYRSLTKSWFEHSPLYDILKGIAERGGRVVITTDHGTIRVDEPSKVVGDRNTNSNLRYKLGKNLTYEGRDVLVIKDPAKAHLPRFICPPRGSWLRHKPALGVYRGSRAQPQARPQGLGSAHELRSMESPAPARKESPMDEPDDDKPSDAKPSEDATRSSRLDAEGWMRH